AVVGMKDRETKQVVARVIERTDGETLRGFVDEHASPDAALYTDDATAYRGSGREHETVKHSAAEYVRYLEGATIHTNGVESFWSMLKRAHKGVYHRLSPKHLQRYVNIFAGRQNVREMDTLAQMQAVVMGMVGRRLMYRDLVANNGLSAVAD
ncbi:MAG: IS1595 family transposase, partial [Gemmatimonadetes bacterium]|nr:IS1595 family transposase [Gemmatimonadota bacterium]